MIDDIVTAKDLIKILKSFPEDSPVLISGYDSGYDCFYYPEIRNLVHKPENMFRDGEFQVPSSGEISELTAVVLERIRRDD